jgi:hypothetical protein
MTAWQNVNLGARGLAEVSVHLNLQLMKNATSTSAKIFLV